MTLGLTSKPSYHHQWANMIATQDGLYSVQSPVQTGLELHIVTKTTFSGSNLPVQLLHSHNMQIHGW